MEGCVSCVMTREEVSVCVEGAGVTMGAPGLVPGVRTPASTATASHLSSLLTLPAAGHRWPLAKVAFLTYKTVLQLPFHDPTALR